MSALQQYIVFGLDGGEYAFPIAAVSEIIRYAEPRATASGLPGVRGVISLPAITGSSIDAIAKLGDRLVMVLRPAMLELAPA